MIGFRIVGFVLAGLFFCCYIYQCVYLILSFRKSPVRKRSPQKHRFAVLICARNEETVISSLLRCLRAQSYEPENVSVFVLADNCTDRTAKVARECGATVWEREDRTHVGKGYALDALLHHIRTEVPVTFDGYIVFDADNLPEPGFIEEMDRVFSDGYEIVVGYRNSLNYGDSWVSAGSAHWFLRGSVNLSKPRMFLGLGGTVAGTGFLFSQKILEAQGNGWPFHTLTEDAEFSAYHILRGEKLGFAERAVFYDEQPSDFRTSCKQRVRWAKGYLQVLKKYGGELGKGALRGNFSCYDLLASIAPAFVLTLFGALCKISECVVGLFCGVSLGETAVQLLLSFAGTYGLLWLTALIPLITEWKKIRTTPLRKILYTFTYPIFMFTYLPIAVWALLSRKVTWAPIPHNGLPEVCNDTEADTALKAALR